MVSEAPVGRSPIVQAEPGREVAGWRVSAASVKGKLHLSDLTALSKVLVRAAPEEAGGVLCEHRRTLREKGTLVIGSGPDAWLVLAPAGRGPALAAELSSRLSECRSLVTVIDVTHGSVVLRLSGDDGRRVLEKLCAIDLSERVTPDGSCFRSRVAGVVCTVARDDEGVPSYLVSSDRSSGQYLFDALLDAGREFGIDVTGYPETEIPT